MKISTYLNHATRPEVIACALMFEGAHGIQRTETPLVLTLIGHPRGIDEMRHVLSTRYGELDAQKSMVEFATDHAHTDPAMQLSRGIADMYAVASEKAIAKLMVFETVSQALGRIYPLTIP